MMRRKFTTGFTLLEVLIALLVFSFGLLGMAKLLVISAQTNRGAYLRTQASFLAQSMADRMRANSNWALWSNLYNYPPATAGSPGSCQGSGAACGYAAIASRDLGVWAAQLARFLPGGTGAINCVAGASVPTSTYNMLPPYSGLCTITITWSESAGTIYNAATAAAQTQTFAWDFQP